MIAENEGEARAQMHDIGLPPDISLDVSGNIFRVPTLDRPRKRDGYALLRVVYIDARPFLVGFCGNFRTGERRTISPGVGASRIKMTSAERAQLDHVRAEQRAAAEAARREKAAEAARRARELFPRFATDGRAPYLQRKGVLGHGVRFVRSSLVVPLVHVTSNELVGLQFIDENGGKRFLTGTAKLAACHWIKRPSQ